MVICALSTSYASMPDTYNVDRGGNVTVGDKVEVKSMDSSTSKISAKDMQVDVKSMNDCGGRRGR